VRQDVGYDGPIAWYLYGPNSKWTETVPDSLESTRVTTSPNIIGARQRLKSDFDLLKEG